MVITKRMGVVFGLGLLAFLGVIWWSGSVMEEHTAHQHTMAVQTWSQDVLAICSESMPEKVAPVAAGAKVVFIVGGRAQTVSLPSALKASGARDVTHVACVDYARNALPTCRYEGGYGVPRYRQDAKVRLVDKAARAVVATWAAQGAQPECPPTIQRRRGQTDTQVLQGPEPDFVGGLFSVPGIKKG